jgi:hypothetical protein
MPVFENHTGINFSESKLQLVELSYKNNSFCLENVDQSVFKESITPLTEESKLIAILQDSFNKITSKKPLLQGSYLSRFTIIILKSSKYRTTIRLQKKICSSISTGNCRYYTRMLIKIIFISSMSR